MQYLLRKQGNSYEGDNRPRLAGAIMQGSVSDREAMMMSISLDDYENSCRTAQQYVADGCAGHVLPIHITQKTFGSAPVTAERFLSLASPGTERLGTDDFSSSDLSEERLEGTFGKIGQTGVRVMWLFGERDQYVPDHVDKQELVGKWEEWVRKGGGVVDGVSGVLPGASHTLEEGGFLVEELVKRVGGLLGRVQRSRAGVMHEQSKDTR